MAFLRFTSLEPRPGSETKVESLLNELDASLAGAPGMVFSLVLRQDERRLGRISLWQSKDAANREAASSHILSLRSLLRYLSVDTEERLLEVNPGAVPSSFTSLQDAAKLLAYFPSSARQFALPAE